MKPVEVFIVLCVVYLSPFVVWRISKDVIIFLLTGNGADKMEPCGVSSAMLRCTKHNLNRLVDLCVILFPFNPDILNTH